MAHSKEKPRNRSSAVLRGVRRLAWWMLVGVAVALVGRYVGIEYLNEQIRGRVEAKCAERFPGLDVRLTSARRVAGLGLELRGLSVRERDADAQLDPLLYADEILLRCAPNLEDVLFGDVHIEQVVVRRPRIRATRQSNGQWNLARLIPPSGFPAWKGTLPDVLIEEGAIQFDDRTRGQARPIQARDVRMTIREWAAPADTSMGRRLVWKGTCTGDLFGSGTLHGECQLASREWVFDCRLRSVDISPELVSLMPRTRSRELEALAALRGRAHVDVRLLGSPEGTRYALAGKLYDGWVNDSSLPYSLTDLEADFTFDQGGLRIENATARTGIARLRLDLMQERGPHGGGMTLRASTQQFPLDRRLPLVLPPVLRTLWEKFLPSGTANVVTTLTLQGGRFKPEAHIECHDLSFAYEKFPYRVHGAEGTLDLKDGILSIQLRLPINGGTTHLTGQVAVGGAEPSGWIEVVTDGPVPLDDALLAALPERPQTLLRSLRPAGMLEMWGRFERNPGESQFHKQMEIVVHGGSMSYDRFPYPLDKIEGTISVRDDQWSFTRMTGRHDSGFIVADGQWNPDHDEGRHLQLSFVCNDVPLQESLRDALRPDVRLLWSKLQPQGTIDRLDIQVRYDMVRHDLDIEVAGQKWGPEQNIEGRTITLRPVWLPYRMDNVTGQFHYRDGVVTLEKVRAEHGPVRLQRLDGVCRHDSAGRWQAQVRNLAVEQARMDEELLAALPEGLSRGLTRLGARGTFSIDGSLDVAGSADAGLVHAGWDLLVDAEDASFDMGTPFEHVRGGTRLKGEFLDGRVVNRGELRIDSLLWRGLHVTQIRGPFRVDNEEVTLGGWSQTQGPSTGLPHPVTARAFDGELSLEGRWSLRGDGQFACVCRLANADLERVEDETGHSHADVSGRIHGGVQVAGRVGVRESWRGEGQVRIVDADIYELPLMVAMLKLLNVRPPDATAFTNGDMQFRIDGDRLAFDRIALQGDAISLIGNGDMNPQKQLNLDFYAVVGREDAQLPIFRPLFKEAARNVLLIKVTGSLNQPTVTPHPFPELNDTLQQLFPETPRDGMIWFPEPISGRERRRE